LVFLDTNIVLYAIGSDESKRIIASSLLAQKPTISTQVINECSHVLRRKQKYSPEEVNRELSAVVKAVILVDVGINEIRSAWSIASRYGFSHFDCLIIATALAANCSVLYSEDLQHGQVIDSRLTICNPFLESKSD
jgi:predicted nucleic acid-binding protein